MSGASISPHASQPGVGVPGVRSRQAVRLPPAAPPTSSPHTTAWLVVSSRSSVRVDIFLSKVARGVEVAMA